MGPARDGDAAGVTQGEETRGAELDVIFIVYGEGFISIVEVLFVKEFVYKRSEGERG
jgi:hypothetical protein